MGRVFAIVCAIVLVVSQAASAQDSFAIARIDAVFRGWAKSLGADSGVLAVTYKGRVVHEAGLNMRADRPVEIASLSKAVTAACVQKAVARGALSYDSTVGAVLGARMPLARQSYGQITVTQLLTHTAGLWPDRTQRSMIGWYRDTSPRYWEASRDALGRKLQRRKPGKFEYNNENYAILGAMLEAATGQSYARYCAPKGGRVSPFTGAYLPYGGWRMSMADYGRFFAKAFARGGVLKDPKAAPSAVVLTPTTYGLGALYRAGPKGASYWHAGAWCMPGRMNAATWSVLYSNGWGVSLSVNKCPRGKAQLRLNKALQRAVFP